LKNLCSKKPAPAALSIKESMAFMVYTIHLHLLHEIELHEKQFNDVHNQGTALSNQRHPAGDVIEVD
jgi:hypothetical protein